jgi:hypothetical protein
MIASAVAGCRQPKLLLIDLRRRAQADIVGIASVIESDAIQIKSHGIRPQSRTNSGGRPRHVGSLPPRGMGAPTVSNGAGDLARSHSRRQLSRLSSGANIQFAGLRLPKAAVPYGRGREGASRSGPHQSTPPPTDGSLGATVWGSAVQVRTSPSSASEPALRRQSSVQLDPRLFARSGESMLSLVPTM